MSRKGGIFTFPVFDSPHRAAKTSDKTHDMRSPDIPSRTDANRIISPYLITPPGIIFHNNIFFPLFLITLSAPSHNNLIRISSGASLYSFPIALFDHFDFQR